MKTLKKRNLFILFFTAILTIMLLATGCNQKQINPKTREDFDAFTKEVFVDQVQSDSITLNYTLSKPEKYGIKNFTPTLGEYTLEENEENLVKYENYLKRLKDFDYDSLTKDQKLTYDILKESLSLNLNLGKYPLYSEILSPTIGFQAQLPVLYAEYNFYDKEDIDDYIKLLNCTDDYFKQIVAIEKEKSKQGLFMNDTAVKDIIDQCNTFIKDKKNNLLITVFNDKVSSFKGLTKDEIRNYKKANKDAVLTSVIPAYENLISELSKLKGTGKNAGGLCNFKNGKEYYKLLVQSETGSKKSISELTDLLEDTMNHNIAKMQAIVLVKPDALDAMEKVKYKLTDPKEIINYLKTAINKNYPALNDVNCTIKYVDKSLQDFLSPAFYLTPAIDNYADNSIYINKSEQFDQSTIFTTIAHEGYPGHLYQCVYFNEQNPAPIRSVLNFGGYTEGWATYVELDSYSLAGLDKSVASLLEKNMAATLCLYARVDIGVNYEGWTKKETGNFLLKVLNTDDDKTVNEFYKSVVEEPGNYLQYTIGYLEFNELRDKAKKQLGDRFVLKDFHEFLLKTGPAPFDVIDNRLDSWIDAQK
ncbi:DUF885 domain-containing protein [Anaeromicropila herbilytica]|uniref:DUF885 domain-containing protein n=1 Tax=Anaeromicropila herbilytica TaxID=2785025 RepID=A0A7R7EHB6_9FIRM|nr:DUF885 domain-containing protein [Anaeromicropila herbilytica]BCN28740.1 hypothetical protein bsdtb5_00350 [Anaeromicropila herbilytica]